MLFKDHGLPKLLPEKQYAQVPTPPALIQQGFQDTDHNLTSKGNIGRVSRLGKVFKGI